jgi:4-hydroxybenzoate polyprenyltransferase
MGFGFPMQYHKFRKSNTVFTEGILTNKKQIAAIAVSIWLIAILVIMLLFQQFDSDIFFILSFIGFLMVVLFIQPHYSRPGYMRFIWYLIALGFLIFGAIIIQKVMDILELEFVYYINSSWNPFFAQNVV